MNAKGRVHKFGDNVDTDVIIPARYLNTASHKELAAHCMEDIDAQFVNKVRQGDIMVAEKNFGCGSSREHAPIAIKASGISCVIASTFARIFYRNAINIGLPILECDDAAREIKDGFISLPKGCYVQLEKKAAKYILDNIRSSYGNTAGLITKIAGFEEDTGLTLTLANFLHYHHLDPRAIYKFDTFSRLCARADVIDNFMEPAESILKKAFLRLVTIDSRRLIRFLLKTLPNIGDINISAFSESEERMLQMFYVSVFLKTAPDWNSEEVRANLNTLADSPTMLAEIIALLQYKLDRIDFIDKPVEVGFDCPLDLHCTYTRDQILVALDFMKPSSLREGVKWLPDKQLDIFFITLNKSDKDYSPTTMYNDYSINSELFHWQSQSTTSESSATGQRYIHHKQRGSRILLFVREFKADRKYGTTEAYTYLGTANYVTHSGSRPMNITWKLDYPIPAKYLKKTNKLVVG